MYIQVYFRNLNIKSNVIPTLGIDVKIALIGPFFLIDVKIIFRIIFNILLIQYICSCSFLKTGLFIRPDETNLYTTLEPTLSSNPNVYFQRGGAVHPGMMY